TLGALPAARAFAARRARREDAAAARLAMAVRLLPEGCARLDLPALGRDAVAVDVMGALLRVVGASRYPPAEAAIRALLERGHGSLAGAVLLRGGRWLVREAAALGRPVPARLGAVWDGRWRLRAVHGEEFMLGALGRGRLRDLAPGWPAAVVAALPALWRQGVPALVPHLCYPSAEACAKVALDFMPASGPAAPQAIGPSAIQAARGHPI
ncbi:MAG: hypothetical protein K2X11_20185, partial [Acetobacteraceae bacterium]|nr:hypothetical protein [Acetobacteraceae bacterium]